MATAAGVGISTAADSLEAARQAARQAIDRCGTARADWGLLFATAPHRPRYAGVLAAVQATLGTDVLAGCSAWGVLGGSTEIEGRPGVAVLAVSSDRIEARTFLVPAGEEEGGPATARELVGRLPGLDEHGLLTLLPDPFAVRPDMLLGELARLAPRARAVGAAASGDPQVDGTFQFYGRNVATRSLAGAYLSGALRSSVAVTQGCQPLGDPGRITRASDNLILEIDGRPALEVLRSRLPAVLRDSLDRLGAHLFVGICPDPEARRMESGEYLVRGLLGADTDRGALAVAAPVHEGQLMVFTLREGQSARDDLKRMLERFDPGVGSGWRFGLYFNCAARGTSLYGMPGVDTAFITRSFGDLPIVGFFGNAEIAPLGKANHMFTHAGVLALVGEDR